MTTWSSLGVVIVVIAGCGPARSGMAGETTSTSAGSSASSSTGTAPATTSSASASSSTSSSPSSTSSASSSGGSSGGTDACAKNVVVMGYWPPTNEMLRGWSTNAAQNPGGWRGADWEGYGYDVYSFFPEFPPDGDPTNDAIGSPGSVGSPKFDLQVDYQATSEDFWRITDELAPVILLTTSRGGDIGWEIEAIEGGHAGGSTEPADDWVTDDYGADVRPTQASIDPRSWDAISTWRAGSTLPTRLPVKDIVAATTALGLVDVVVDRGTSGNYLSGFLGLHGLHYQRNAAHAVAAGHIHVGGAVSVADAEQLVRASLRAVLAAHPADRVTCRR